MEHMAHMILIDHRYIAALASVIAATSPE